MKPKPGGTYTTKTGERCYVGYLSPHRAPNWPYVGEVIRITGAVHTVRWSKDGEAKDNDRDSIKDERK